MLCSEWLRRNLSGMNVVSSLRVFGKHNSLQAGTCNTVKPIASKDPNIQMGSQQIINGLGRGGPVVLKANFCTCLTTTTVETNDGGVVVQKYDGPVALGLQPWHAARTSPESDHSCICVSLTAVSRMCLADGGVAVPARRRWRVPASPHVL